MTGCATTYEAGAPEGAVDVVAHRGASAYAPENTLAAFGLAAEQDADWFELDCTLSKDGAVIVEKVRNEKGHFGYDAQNDKFCDMVAEGIIDPKKVVRLALQNAASVATLLLTTDAIVSEIPEKKAPAAAPGGYDEDM